MGNMLRNSALVKIQDSGGDMIEISTSTSGVEIDFIDVTIMLFETVEDLDLIIDALTKAKMAFEKAGENDKQMR